MSSQEGRERVWPAPAKLNLFLHILGRRADGYHELQSCFQFVDLCDDVVLRVRADGKIRRGAGAVGVEPEADLCVRAARALQAASGCSSGIDIDVLKRIPMGAGLGGGSSDAATCLVALNHLWKLKFTPDELALLGLSLGADVPVFVRARAAWAEGVGERLTLLRGAQAPLENHYLIIKPNVSVSTRDVFEDPDLTRNSAAMSISDYLRVGGGNDCLPVVRRRYPAVARALLWLSRYGEARLTGTGACVFAVCASAQQGAEIAREMPPEFTAYVVRGMNDSPLQAHLAAVQNGEPGS